MRAPCSVSSSIAVVLFVAGVGAGCPAEPYGGVGASQTAKAQRSPEGAVEAIDAARKRTPEIVPAPEGPLDVAVRAAMQTAAQDERRLLVYVGATWCEPCQDFHHAVERGELDEALAGVRFLELDSDRDAARLRDAGYDGRYIPRFVLPGADGRGTDQRVEGGIKGPGSVEHIMQRLSALLAPAQG